MYATMRVLEVSAVLQHRFRTFHQKLPSGSFLLLYIKTIIERKRHIYKWLRLVTPALLCAIVFYRASLYLSKSAEYLWSIQSAPDLLVYVYCLSNRLLICVIVSYCETNPLFIISSLNHCATRACVLFILFFLTCERQGDYRPPV